MSPFILFRLSLSQPDIEQCFSQCNGTERSEVAHTDTAQGLPGIMLPQASLHMMVGFTAYLSFTDLTDIFSILQVDFPTPTSPKLGQVLLIYI